MYIVFSGGVGGAKLVDGLAKILEPDELVIIVNTADDFKYWGLHISPDIDTVLYHLANIKDPKQGWGVKDDSQMVLNMMKKLRQPSWFCIGDQDLSTHILRNELLMKNHNLTQVTVALCKLYGIKHKIVPMTDDLVQTKVHVLGRSDPIEFQDYFVKLKCRPKIKKISYSGITSARANPVLMNLLDSPEKIKGIIIAPSNPFLSIYPILNLPFVREKLIKINKPILGVSPIINSKAVKGPLSSILKSLYGKSDINEILLSYRELLTDFIIDTSDSESLPYENDYNITIHKANILLDAMPRTIELAKKCCSIIETAGIIA